jgi:hypothetical protein
MDVEQNAPLLVFRHRKDELNKLQVELTNLAELLTMVSVRPRPLVAASVESHDENEDSKGK